MTNITLLGRAGQSRRVTNSAVSDVRILMSLAGHVRPGRIARGECHVAAFVRIRTKVCAATSARATRAPEGDAKIGVGEVGQPPKTRTESDRF